MRSGFFANGVALSRVARVAHGALSRIWLALVAARLALVIAGLWILAFNAFAVHAQARTESVATASQHQTAASRSPLPMSAKERAYTLTVMCTVVAAHDNSDRDHTRALDAARKMAKVLGYAEMRLAHDLIATANVLGDDLRSDPNAIARNREICQRLQLAS